MEIKIGSKPQKFCWIQIETITNITYLTKIRLTRLYGAKTRPLGKLNNVFVFKRDGNIP